MSEQRHIRKLMKVYVFFQFSLMFRSDNQFLIGQRCSLSLS